MSTRRSLPLVGAAGSGRLGVLSVHLDGAPCRVGCPFCYLGDRAANDAAPTTLDPALVASLVGGLAYDELAVALSEPVEQFAPQLAALVDAATQQRKPVTVTTTAAIVLGHPEVLDGTSRVNVSIDPRKGPVDARYVERVARAARGPLGHGAREVVVILTLVDEAFARVVTGGLLAHILDVGAVDKVALNALKPPPAWCGKKFWLSTCARLAPLLARHLDRRLFLDCWVAARILGVGGCPARPDVSPGPAFRSCVYQPAPDFMFSTVEELGERLARFAPPDACPFAIPE